MTVLSKINNFVLKGLSGAECKSKAKIWIETYSNINSDNFDLLFKISKDLTTEQKEMFNSLKPFLKKSKKASEIFKELITNSTELQQAKIDKSKKAELEAKNTQAINQFTEAVLSGMFEEDPIDLQAVENKMKTQKFLDELMFDIIESFLLATSQDLNLKDEFDQDSFITLLEIMFQEKKNKQDTDFFTLIQSLKG